MRDLRNDRAVGFYIVENAAAHAERKGRAATGAWTVGPGRWFACRVGGEPSRGARRPFRLDRPPLARCVVMRGVNLNASPMASPIPPSQPIPLERSIRWVPAGSRTETDGYAEYRSIVIPSVSEESVVRRPEIPRSARNDTHIARNDTHIEDHAIFISQDALREVGDHARTSAGDDVLGFLLGERYECPDSGTHYAVITTVVRTGHVIAESDVVQIPDEEWLGIQLEVRRRHLTLIGWYHTAPFVALNPSRWDLDTQRARFTEPWQCGLVIATGDRAAGGFFRTAHGSSSAQMGP